LCLVSVVVGGGEEGDSGDRHDQDLQVLIMNPVVFFLGPAGGGGGEEGDSGDGHNQDLQFL
jgi:hypothetical protein